MKPHMSAVEKAVLGTFLLNPMDELCKGRQAVEIVRCAPHAFHRIKSGCNRLLLTLIVAQTCRTLVQRGYLEKSGTVRRRFTLPYPSVAAEAITRPYDSPIFRLTESGFMQMLNVCRFEDLPPLLLNPKSKRPRKPRTVFEMLYGNDAYHVSTAFLTALSGTSNARTKCLHSTST